MWVVSTTAAHACLAIVRCRSLLRVWLLSGVSEPVFVLHRSDLLPNETLVYDPQYLPLLDRLLADPLALRSVLEMYEAVSGCEVTHTWHRFGRQPELFNLKERLERSFRTGELVLVRGWYRPGLSTIGGGPEQQEAPIGRAAAVAVGAGEAAPDSQKQKTWIQFQLVDQDGQPVPYERYRLHLTDGSVQEGTLDAKGSVRVDGIDAGTCQISFPDIHAAEWKAA